MPKLPNEVNGIGYWFVDRLNLLNFQSKFILHYTTNYHQKFFVAAKISNLRLEWPEIVAKWAQITYKLAAFFSTSISRNSRE